MTQPQLVLQPPAPRPLLAPNDLIAVRRRPSLVIRQRDGTAAIEVDPILIERLTPMFRALAKYSRLHVEGLDHVPAGRAILVSNHTGCLGLDFAFAALALRSHDGRLLRGLVHDAWFQGPKISDLARRLGFVPPSRRELWRLLGEDHTVLVFPEGEAGAFKPGLKGPHYELQEFRRGFVRAAIETGAPIVPMAVVGGEEANPVLRTFSFTKARFGLPFPLPLTLMPLPVKWRIQFLPQIRIDEHADAGDATFVHGLADRIRDQIQEEVRRQLRLRGNRFL